MTFDLNDYVDVNARIAMMVAKYPEMSLQSELEPLFNGLDLAGWKCKAYAYRTPDDTRPGIGHAFEPVPGKTSYTKDSEAMNAETSAWGRAIVALGFETRKIASANEVQARQEPSPTQPATDTSRTPPADAQTAPFTVDKVEGPNGQGWYELHTADGRKFSTKKHDLVAGATAGSTVLVTWKEVVKGNYTNRYIEALAPVPAGGSVINDDDIPF